MYFKFLSAGGQSPFAYCHWNLPYQREDGTQIPGQWMAPIIGELRLCVRGYHAARPEHIFHWLRKDMYELEFRDPSEVIDDGYYGGPSFKVAGREARLLRRIDSLTNDVLKEQAILALEDVLRAKRPRSPRALDLARTILAIAKGEPSEWTYYGLRGQIQNVQRAARFGGPSAALLSGCWDLLDMALAPYGVDHWRPSAFTRLAAAMPNERKALATWSERLLAHLGIAEATTKAA